MPSEAHDRMAIDAPARLSIGLGDGIPELRRNFEALLASFPVPDDVTEAPIEAPGVTGTTFAIAGTAPSKTILYFHGGGYVMGSSSGYKGHCGRIARAADARIACIDYRLAPEHPFPAAIDDAVAAYDALIASGLPRERIIIGGDSAGGAIALALLMRLRDRGTPMPARAFILSAFIDLCAASQSFDEKAAVDPFCNREAVAGLAAAYAPDRLDDPLASPVYGDYRGLPPLLFIVGTRETILDDSFTAVEKARAAGVEAHLIAEEGLVHVWPLFGPDIPETARTMRQIGDFVNGRPIAY